MQGKEKIHPFDIIVGLRGITHLDKLVLFKIYNLDNGNRGCFAKDDWFADLFNVHKKSINRCIARLEENNLILKTHPKGDRQIKVNLPSSYHASNPTVTSSLPCGYSGGNPTVDNKTKEKTKELNKRESPLSNFEILEKDYPENINSIRSKYKLPRKEWLFCIGKFNEKDIRIPSIQMFDRYVNNWKNNLNQTVLEHERQTNPNYSEGI